MLLMFLSNCYPFYLLLLLSSLYCFWLLIPRISCLIQKVSLGSLRSLFSMFLPLSITTVSCCFPGSLSFYNCPSAYAQRCLVLCWLTWDEEKNTSVNQQTDFCGSHLYSYCWPLLWSLPADHLWGDFMGEGVCIQFLITVLNSDSWPCSYCRCSFKTHLLHWFLNSVFNLNI